jgi:hypothetical protein
MTVDSDVNEGHASGTAQRRPCGFRAGENGDEVAASFDGLVGGTSIGHYAPLGVAASGSCAVVLRRHDA